MNDKLTTVDIITYNKDQFVKQVSELEYSAYYGDGTFDSNNVDAWYTDRTNNANEAVAWYNVYNAAIQQINISQAIADAPQAKPINTYVLRPEAYEVLLQQMCAYITSIGGTATECAGVVIKAKTSVIEPVAAVSADNTDAENAAIATKALADAGISTETFTEATLAGGIDDHLDEDDSENTVALVFAVIGAILLSGTVGFIMWRYVCGAPGMKKTNANGMNVLVNQSNNSSRTAGQSKLDDIM